MITRRSLGKLAAVMTVPRRPDQRFTPPAAVLPAQSQSGVFTRVFVGNDFVINSSGAFFYQGAPALGNLIASIAGIFGGHDVKGNTFLPGVSVYSPGSPTLAVNIDSGSLKFQRAPAVNGVFVTFQQVNLASDGSSVTSTLTTPWKFTSTHVIFQSLTQMLLSTISSPTAATTALLEVQGDFAANPLSALATGSVSNSIAEAVIGTFTVPANDAAAGSAYEFRVFGAVNVAAGTTVTLRLRLNGLGGTQIFSSGALTARVLTGLSFAFDGRWLVRGGGAGGHIDAWSRMMEQIVAAAAADHPDMAGFVALDTTVSYTCVVTAQFSVANAGNTAQTQEGTLVRFSH